MNQSATTFWCRPYTSFHGSEMPLDSELESSKLERKTTQWGKGREKAKNGENTTMDMQQETRNAAHRNHSNSGKINRNCRWRACVDRVERCRGRWRYGGTLPPPTTFLPSPSPSSSSSSSSIRLWTPVSSWNTSLLLEYNLNPILLEYYFDWVDVDRRTAEDLPSVECIHCKDSLRIFMDFHGFSWTKIGDPWTIHWGFLRSSRDPAFFLDPSGIFGLVPVREPTGGFDATY